MKFTQALVLSILQSADSDNNCAITTKYLLEERNSVVQAVGNKIVQIFVVKGLAYGSIKTNFVPTISDLFSEQWYVIEVPQS